MTPMAQRSRMAWRGVLLVVALCALGTVSAPPASAATTGSLSGRVTHGTTPLAGIRVWLYTVPGKAWVGSAVTAADGSYSLPTVAPGTYRLQAWSSTGAHPAVWYGQATSFATATDLIVTTGSARTGLDINLATRGTIAGSVTHAGAGVADVNVLLFREDGTFLGGRSTDAAGAYAIPNLPPGGYTLNFHEPAGRYPSAGFWPDKGDAQDAQVIHVEAGITFVADQHLYTAADHPVDPYTVRPGGPRVAVVGDSITQQSSHLIHKAIDPLAATTVRGISGQRIDELQPVVDKMAALVPPPDQVIIAAGSNDVIQSRSLATMQASLLTMIDSFPSATCVTVMNVSTSTASVDLNARAQIWNNWLTGSLKSVRPKAQVLDWAAVRLAYLQAGNPQGSWTLEGLHLTELGEAAYANLMRESVLACGAPEASVSGTSFVDGNTNGIREAGELELAGETITITGSDRLGNQQSRSALTAPDGTWTVTAPAGTYTIAQSPSLVLGLAFALVGSAGGVATSAGIANVVLDHGAAATGYHFATPPGRSSLSGTVYADLDANGVRDPGEPGLERASIHVTGVDSYGLTVNRTTATTADGTWSLDISPGTYDIVESPATGYQGGTVATGGAGGTPGPRTVTGVGISVGQAVAGVSFAEIPLPVGSWAIGTANGVARSVAVGSDGTIVVVGAYRSSITLGTPENGVTLSTAGHRAGYLATYDAGGGLVWAVNLASTVSAETFKVAIDGAGNIVVAGDFIGSATFGSAADQVTMTGAVLTGFVASFAPGGVLRWAKAVDDAPASMTTGVDVDAAGDVYVTGAFQQTAVFGRVAGVGGTTLTGTGMIDGFVARYTADGSFVTARPLNTLGGVLPLDVAVSAAGAATVVGTHGGYDFGGGYAVKSAGQLDGFVVSFDATTTNITWSRSLGSFGSDNVFGVAVDDATGTIVLSGGFAETVDFGNGQVLTAANTAVSDGYVAALDAAGTTLWARSGGGMGSDRGARISVGSGHVHVAGFYTGDATFGAETTLSYGGEDGYIASYDLAGSLEWVRPVGGAGNDSAWGVATAANGDAIAVGSFIGPAAVMPGPVAFGLQGSGEGAFVTRLHA